MWQLGSFQFSLLNSRKAWSEYLQPEHMKIMKSIFFSPLYFCLMNLPALLHAALSSFIAGGAVGVRSRAVHRKEDHSSLSHVKCHLQIHQHCAADCVSSCFPPTSSEAASCVFGLFALFWPSHHALPSFACGAAALILSSTNKRVQSSMIDVNPVAVLVRGVVSRLSMFWFSFSLPGKNSALCVSWSPHTSLLLVHSSGKISWK